MYVVLFSIAASANPERLKFAQDLCRTTLKELASNQSSWLTWKEFNTHTGTPLSAGVSFFGHKIPLFSVETSYIQLFQINEPEIIFNNNFKYIQSLKATQSRLVGVSGAGIEKHERTTDLLRESYSYSPDNLNCHKLNERTTSEEFTRLIRVATLLIIKAASSPQSIKFVVDPGPKNGFISVKENSFIHHWEDESAEFAYFFVLGNEEKGNLEKYLSDYLKTLLDDKVSLTRQPAYEIVMDEWSLSGENDWINVIDRLRSLGDMEILIGQISRQTN